MVAVARRYRRGCARAVVVVVVLAAQEQVQQASGGERLGIFLLIVVETLAWFSLVAMVFALPKMRRGYQRLAKWIDGVAGVVFAGFGIALIVNR